ncbi:hypothetical protein AVEN_126034-1 [Araneus ventricosus]|uniref:Uncharacterized protein n=1 Tax=Araneus ventricosus TaxID=182803 RepID=A0A4Y2QE97_ARAVE|nr:hypothetical protein AVEN_126034-1 [Araneus ventricosus]
MYFGVPKKRYIETLWKLVRVQCNGDIDFIEVFCKAFLTRKEDGSCPFGSSDAYLRKDVIDDSSCLAAMHQEKISRTRITELMFRLLCAEAASVLKQTQ